MSLALILGLMALTGTALLALPLLRQRDIRGERAAYDLAVYRDQLEELDRDLERGLIGEDEARAARIEVERRILSAARSGSASDGRENAAPQQTRKPVTAMSIFALIALVPAAGAAFYLILGSPNLPDQPLAERPRAAPQPQGMTAERFGRMVAMVEERLKANPGEIQGWIILSTAYLRLNRPADAEKALERAIGLAAGNKARAAGIAVNYGEALVAMNNGQVVPRAKAVFDRARTLVPKHPAARYYQGLARLQAGDAAAALEIWKGIAADAPPDAPYLPRLKKRIARLAEEIAGSPKSNGTEARP